MGWKRLFVITLVSYAAYQHFTKPNNIQVTQLAGDGSVHLNGYHIKPLETFSIEARVLGAEHYRLDREADLSPIDLALGWGQMADENILKEISISQSNRFYYWRVQNFPIPRREIETHSANMHMIPTTPEIAEAIKSVKVGDTVKFNGDLVEVTHADGWRWKSSLTRNDTGAGACELVLVKSFSLL